MFRVPDRLRQTIPRLIGLALFLVSLEILRLELRAVSWRELSGDVFAVPPSRLASALILTLLNYAALAGYDLLAFAYIKNNLRRLRIAAVSFLAYAISHNIGFAMLSGASVHYRFYSRWGVTAEELSRIIFSYSVTFWLGLLMLGGLSLAVNPSLPLPGLPAGPLMALAGWLLALAAAAYLPATMLRRRPLRVGRFELPLPPPRIAAAQLAISVVEWALAGAVLYVLLPPSELSFLKFLGSFLAAILVGMASHVPGGVGVFEGMMVVLLKPYLSSGQLLPSLVVYRALYYLLPLAIALAGLVADELRRRREQTARVSAAIGQWTELLTPRLLAVFAFLSGMVLLFSGATPAAPGRLERLGQLLPLGVIEASHFLGSVAGAMLLLLSQGLWRRLDAAYYLASATIIAGMAASILKGLDYEEAVLLAIVFLVLRGGRFAFDRRAAFFATRFSSGWVAALVATVGASIWLGFFAFKHVDYSNELWWQVEAQSEVPRFLRASVGAAVVLLLFGFARLFRFAPHQTDEPTEEDLDTAGRVIANQTSTSGNLVYLRDKALLFSKERNAFLTYGVQGRTWAALRDPVGPPDQIPELIRTFLEKCDDFGGVAVFYEVTTEHLHRYADFGLTFVKLGEEAKVDLNTFALEGSHGARYRQSLRRLEKEGCAFRIVEPAEVPAILHELRAVSDDWLTEKAGAEKGFSLGFFDDAYLVRFPIAVIERAGRIQAFANIWRGAQQHELSVDLMRYHHDAPKSVIEALFVHLMKWGKEHGYRWFALGMAPLSGFERSPVAPLWARIGTFLYEHGESVYNYQGLRAYKEKFNPVWEPRYLAYPGGLRLPRILADLSALVAGGYRRIFLKR